ncbi:hypothetical protein LINPERHAP2_LOCUS35252 [Linum perenne]
MTSSPRVGLLAGTDQAATVDSYGPWMIASRRSRRAKKGNSVIKESNPLHYGEETRKETSIKELKGPSPVITPTFFKNMEDLGEKEINGVVVLESQRKAVSVQSDGGGSPSGVNSTPKPSSNAGLPLGNKPRSKNNTKPIRKRRSGANQSKAGPDLGPQPSVAHSEPDLAVQVPSSVAPKQDEIPKRARPAEAPPDLQADPPSCLGSSQPSSSGVFVGLSPPPEKVTKQFLAKKTISCRTRSPASKTTKLTPQLKEAPLINRCSSSGLSKLKTKPKLIDEALMLLGPNGASTLTTTVDLSRYLTTDG